MLPATDAENEACRLLTLDGLYGLTDQLREHDL